MENIQLIKQSHDIEEFMSMENGLVKNVKYYNSIQGKTYNDANICKKDGCIYYSSSSFKIVKSVSKSYYIKRTSKSGFTINEKGKLSVWFNQNIFQIPFINEVFNYFNFNWLSKNLYCFITKGIFEKMIAGKITNNTEVCKAYIKVMRLNCSPALLLNLFLENRMSKQQFLREASIAKDVNHLIEYYLNPIQSNSSFIIEDMIKEAQILEKKIDFKWSLNRLKEEHKSWTEQIMQVEIDSLEDKPISSVERFDKYTPNRFKLLKTQKEVFYEGRMMKHCIYTSYWSSIKHGSYLAYHVELDGEEATLGVNVYSDKIFFNQCYTRYNQPISTNMSVLVKQFVEELNEQAERDGIFRQPVNNIINQPLPF